MGKMYFRNYSLTCHGSNVGLPDLLKTISEGAPVMKQVEFLLIASFSSALNLDELESLLKDGGYSFTLFEMDPDSSRAHMTNKTMQERLYDNFFYKRIELEDLADIAPIFSGDGEYIEYEDIGSSKLSPEVYLNDLLNTLQEALENEEYEEASEVRDEIKGVDPEFYEKHVKNGNFLK